MSGRAPSQTEASRAAGAAIVLTIPGRPRDLGGFSVRRILPSIKRRLVGPFIFFDHMGPAEFPPGAGIDVRPHPHIGLATVTYLFAGEIIHRDSLGYVQPIEPGAVNWMTAGRGIVHSERTGPEERARLSRLHGIQSWVALPIEAEEIEPSFHHHPAESLPVITGDGVWLRLIAGAAYGQRAPVLTLSDLFYLDAALAAGARLRLPDEYRERSIYPVEGSLLVNGEPLPPGVMAVLGAGPIEVRAETTSRIMLLGGAPLIGERQIWWNFVSSSGDRIERAKADWRQGRFGLVPGDNERIPLPDS